jgi:hypothetical protein
MEVINIIERKGALLQQTDEFDGATSDIIKSAHRFGSEGMRRV